MHTRVLICGAGAVGSYLGAFWARAGHEVTLCDPWPAHVDAIERAGVRVTGTQGDHVVPIEAIHVGELQANTRPYDVIVLAPKLYDAAWMAQLVLPHLAPHGVVTCAMNGLPDERVAKIAGAHRVVGCVIAGMETAVWEPGVVVRGGAVGRDAGTTVFKLGELDGDGRRASEVAALFDLVDAAAVTSDLPAERFAKLVQNAMTHPLPALTGSSDAALAADPRARELRRRIACEGARVGLAEQLRLGTIAGLAAEVWAEPDREANAAAIDARLRRAKAADWKTSMLQDVMKGRRTEVDDLNGELARRAHARGLRAPVNEAVTRAVRAVQARERPMAPERLAELFEDVPRAALD